jgi:hypothetical protein
MAKHRLPDDPRFRGVNYYHTDVASRFKKIFKRQKAEAIAKAQADAEAAALQAVADAEAAARQAAMDAKVATLKLRTK